MQCSVSVFVLCLCVPSCACACVRVHVRACACGCVCSSDSLLRYRPVEDKLCKCGRCKQAAIFVRSASCPSTAAPSPRDIYQYVRSFFLSGQWALGSGWLGGAVAAMWGELRSRTPAGRRRQEPSPVCAPASPSSRPPQLQMPVCPAPRIPPPALGAHTLSSSVFPRTSATFLPFTHQPTASFPLAIWWFSVFGPSHVDVIWYVFFFNVNMWVTGPGPRGGDEGRGMALLDQWGKP